MGKLYNLSETATSYYLDGLVYYLIGGLLLGVIKVISSYLYATNKKIKANLLIFLDPFILTPIGLLVFTVIFKLYGVWVTYLFVQAILAMTAVGLLAHKKIFQKVSSIDN